jgi:Conjugal transfer protein TraD
MPDTIAEKKTRLDKLAEQKATIEAKLKVERERVQKQQRKTKTAEAGKLRKVQTRLKIEYGGLVDIAELLGIDKGAVLGVLLWAAKKFKEDQASFTSFKKQGDVVLIQRETAKKKLQPALVSDKDTDGLV